MKTTRLIENYRIDSYEYECALRQRRNAIRRKREMKKHMLMFVLGIICVLFLSFSYQAITINADETTEDVSYKYYTSIMIESGDTLWTLAAEYGDDIHYKSTADYIKEVMQINHLSDDRIKTGDFLIVPYYSNEFVMASN